MLWWEKAKQQVKLKGSCFGVGPCFGFRFEILDFRSTPYPKLNSSVSVIVIVNDNVLSLSRLNLTGYLSLELEEALDTGSFGPLPRDPQA